MEKYKLMTEQLRITNSDEEVGNYLRWIITSDASKAYWENELNNNMENNIKTNTKTIERVMEYIAIRVQNGEWKYLPKDNKWKGRYEDKLTSEQLFEIVKKELNIWDI